MIAPGSRLGVLDKLTREKEYATTNINLYFSCKPESYDKRLASSTEVYPKDLTAYNRVRNIQSEYRNYSIRPHVKLCIRR